MPAQIGGLISSAGMLEMGIVDDGGRNPISMVAFIGSFGALSDAGIDDGGGRNPISTFFNHSFQ